MDQLADVALQLYGLAPQDFTAARNERAKAVRSDGNKELAERVRRLQKPSASAWAVNLLARRRPDSVEQVIELGEALRSAQERLDRDELTRLNGRRRELLASVVEQGRALATELGHPINEAAADEIERTLWAAMADRAAAGAVQTGLLVTALSSTTPDAAELAASVAVPGAVQVPDAGADEDAAEAPPKKPASRTAEQDRRRAEQARAQAERNAEDSERRAAEAESELTEAEEHFDELEESRERLQAELEDLRTRIEDVEQELVAVELQAQAAQRQRDRARRSADQARDRADRDRARLRRR